MKAADDKLFQAREFAELTGVTVRTLHHYDRLGLLKPSRYSRGGIGFIAPATWPGWNKS